MKFDFPSRLAVIWTMLTRFPLPRSWWPDRVIAGDRILSAAPLAGGLFGLASGLFSAAVMRIGVGMTPSAWLTAAFYIIFGWVLHLDGWSDLWDGIGSGKSGEDMRAIMKDSHTGAFGTAGLIMAIGLWASLVASISLPRRVFALAIAGAAGRFASCCTARAGRYPWESGMAKGWVGAFTKTDMAEAFVCFLIFAPFAPLSWALSALIAATAGFAAAKWMNRRLGGANGDVLGAVEVTSELLSLVVFSL